MLEGINLYLVSLPCKKSLKFARLPATDVFVSWLGHSRGKRPQPLHDRRQNTFKAKSRQRDPKYDVFLTRCLPDLDLVRGLRMSRLTVA